MKTCQRFASVLSITLLFGFPADLKAQTDSLVDVFPLAVGNRWTYRYYAYYDYAPAGTPVETRTDSGLVVYTLALTIPGSDSTRWQINVQRDLLRHQIFWMEGRDTTYPLRDSSSFELVEKNNGQHQIYRNADPYMIRHDIFPFTPGYVDSTRIYRFRTVGTGDTVAFRSWIYPPPGSIFRSTFTFKKGVGLLRNRYNSGSVDVYSKTEHYLLNSIITSLNTISRNSIPEDFSLLQNYPNPFNPTTNIVYGVASRELVELKVFDILGREVAVLVDQVQDAGFKTIQFDGGGLASGVYFYRLEAANFVATKKLLLIR